MLDHVKFGVSNYAEIKAFFLKALEPLGVEAGAEGARENRGTHYLTRLDNPEPAVEPGLPPLIWLPKP